MASKKTHCKRGHEFTEENSIVGIDGFKRCRKCKEERQRNYWIKNKDKLYKINRQWAIDNHERTRELGRKWDKLNQNKRTNYRREHWWVEYLKNLRIETFTIYGNGKCECVCCGENINQFLTLDHINGRTEEEKKNSRSRGWQGYQKLRKLGYPSGYQTLCWNCNSGRQLNNGICPHKSTIKSKIEITQEWQSN